MHNAFESVNHEFEISETSRFFQIFGIPVLDQNFIDASPKSYQPKDTIDDKDTTHITQVQGTL